ncbi:MAG: hypothetical protein P1U34_09870 [Coxiellaceae bacterium]|nr:hypothetical protein [Coxiellaceae bacterium]
MLLTIVFVQPCRTAERLMDEELDLWTKNAFDCGFRSTLPHS